MNSKTKKSIIKWSIIITIILAILGTAISIHLWIEHIQAEAMASTLYGAPTHRPETE